MTPDLPFWIPLCLLGAGMFLVLRATVLVASKSEGRFRGDVWVSLAAGFGVLLLGQFLLRR